MSETIARIESIDSSPGSFTALAPRPDFGPTTGPTLHYPILGFCLQAKYLRQMVKSKFTKADDVFRDLLKRLRMARNLTQAGLAARLGHPQSYVSKYETGERRLDFVETAWVCEAMGIEVSDFAARFAKELSKARRRKDS